MKPEPRPTDSHPQGPPSLSQRRVYVFEPGWGVGLKIGCERVFCYAMAPGQDYYHRLLDGEIYVVHDAERLCLACAERRGLISFEARGLRESLLPIDLLDDAAFDADDGSTFQVADEDDEDE